MTTAFKTFARVPKTTCNTPKLLPGKNSFLEIKGSPEDSRQGIKAEGLVLPLFPGAYSS